MPPPSQLDKQHHRTRSSSSPTPARPAPPDFARSQDDEDIELDDVDVEGDEPPSNQKHEGPQDNPQRDSPPTSPDSTPKATRTADDAKMDEEAVFVHPTRDEWLDAEPTHTSDNPHRPSPAHDPDSPVELLRMSGFQSREPGWTMPVLPNHVILQNIDPELRETIEANPDQYLAITPFCGGSKLTEKYINLRADLNDVFDEVAKGKITLAFMQPHVTTKGVRRGGPNSKIDKYIPPLIIVGKCSDPATRAVLTGQGTFAHSRLLAFHVSPFDTTLLSWAVGFFKTDIEDPPAVTQKRLCYAMYKAMLKNPKILGLVDRATQRGSKLSREKRTLDFAQSFEGRFLPHDTDPVYVLMAKPCTNDAGLWDELRAAMRVVCTDQIESFVPHANAASGHNICANCKYDCHPKYICMFSVRDKSWWGPADMSAILKELNNNEGSDDEMEGAQRGAPRGRTRGGRGVRAAGNRSRR